MPEVSNEALQDMVAYVEKTDGILAKAASQEEEVSKIAPTVIDELVNAGLLDHEKKAQALADAANPVKLLGSLYKAAKFIGHQKQASAAPAPMGKAEVVKNAGTSVSAKAMKESDKLFLERFGF